MIAAQVNRFPHDPVLVQLLAVAGQTPATETIVEDDALGCEKTYPELLGDILETQKLLRAQLPSSAISEDGLLYEKRQYITFLAKSGYEFLVAFFSIRSIGGVCVPLGTGVLPEEAEYFLSVVNSVCMLAGRGSMERAGDIRTHIKKLGKSDGLVVVPICCDAKPLGDIDRAIKIDNTRYMAPDEPGVVFFTSGTTGRPKGVVLPRCSIIGTGVREANSLELAYRPCHWIGGARNLVWSVLSGRKLYSLITKIQDPRAEGILKAFRTHLITDVAFMPDVLRRMMLILTQHRGLHSIPEEEKDTWRSYFKGLSVIRCSGGPPEPSTREFWEKLTGLSFENCYASTELGGLAIGGLSRVHGSMGTPVPGVKVKLSEGDRGELYVKSPKMLLRYIGDKDAAQSNIFDEDGYFPTGDLANFKDGEYIFAGRVLTDCIQYTAFRFSALAVENGLTDLPYISEACVVAVPNKKARQLCGAVVRLRPEAILPTKTTTLERIRSDLEGNLPTYMMPTLLRVLNHKEELPYTSTGKPIKKEILKVYFGSVDGAQVDDYPPGVERCALPKPGGATKAWDWDGRQFEH